MFHQDDIGPFMLLYGRRYYVRCTRGELGILVQNKFYPVEYEKDIKYITKDGVRHEDTGVFMIVCDEPDILNPTYHAVNLYRDSVRHEYTNRYGMESAWIAIPLYYYDKDKAIEEIKKNKDNLKNVSSALWKNVDFLTELSNLEIGNIRSSIPNSLTPDVMRKIRTMKQETQLNRSRFIKDVDLANKEVI